MVKKCFVLIILVAALGYHASAQKNKKKEYQITAIAFYNFENLFDTLDDPKKFDEDFTPKGAYQYTTEIYHQKLHNLATVLQRLAAETTPDGPALIGTAEIENDLVLQDLVAQPEIKSRNYQFIRFESPDSRGIDVALLYNPKYFKVLHSQALLTDISKYGTKGGRTRDVLYVSGILAGDTVNVFVNHWPSRRGGQAASEPLRRIAAGVSKKVIDSLMNINPNTKVIVMGDLNDDPVDESITEVLGAKGDIDKVKTSGLYNPWVSFYKKGLGTLGYDDRWNLFDQIMISEAFLKKGDDHWRYYKAEVFNRDFLISKFGQYKGYPHRSFAGETWINGYSDHLPTIIYLVKPIQ